MRVLCFALNQVGKCFPFSLSILYSDLSIKDVLFFVLYCRVYYLRLHANETQLHAACRFMSKQVAASHASSKPASLSPVLNIPTQSTKGITQIGFLFSETGAVCVFVFGRGVSGLLFHFSRRRWGHGRKKEEWEVGKPKCSFYPSPAIKQQ